MGRYDRQLLELTEEEQGRISSATVGLVGCGGLGTSVATALALAGVGRLRMMDPDVPEESNLNRQYAFCGHVGDGRSKAELLAAWVRGLNPSVEVEYERAAFGPGTRGFLDGCDVLVDCLDSIGARMELNGYSAETGRPLVHGGIDAFVGEVAVCVPGRTPCLRCMMGSVPEREGPPASIGSVVSTVGSMQATEVLKLLAGRRSETEGVFLSMDFERWRMTPVRFPRDPGCPVCGRLRRLQKCGV